jgi:hypothetical protein
MTLLTLHPIKTLSLNKLGCRINFDIFITMSEKGSAAGSKQ